MTTETRTKRYTFHQPAAEFRGTEPGLREVRDEGQPIGLINKHLNGYVLRDLSGRKLDTTYGISRDTSAGVLAQVAAATAIADTITDAELLRTFAHLTHQMDAAIDGLPYKQNLRAQRDLVEAEILRRMAAGR